MSRLVSYRDDARIAVAKLRRRETPKQVGYFSKPRMYGMTGGRGPVLKSGLRVER